MIPAAFRKLTLPAESRGNLGFSREPRGHVSFFLPRHLLGATLTFSVGPTREGGIECAIKSYYHAFNIFVKVIINIIYYIDLLNIYHHSDLDTYKVNSRKL